MPSPRGWQRLGRLAEPLQPTKPPYHVSAVRRGHPAPGWYWMPAGVQHPAYLGFNHVHAEMALLELLDRQEAAA